MGTEEELGSLGAREDDEGRVRCGREVNEDCPVYRGLKRALPRASISQTFIHTLIPRKMGENHDRSRAWSLTERGA